MGKSSKSKTFSVTDIILLKYALESVPGITLGKITLYLRQLLRYLLSSTFLGRRHLSIMMSTPSTSFDIITYQHSQLMDRYPTCPKSRANDIILCIHGGGFTICDNTDIFLSVALLPVLRELLGYQPPSIYSIRYTLAPKDGDLSTIHTIHSEIYHAYKDLVRQGKNIVSVIGDSAGGNLAISLVLRLMAESAPSTPTLCLVSPWLHLFANDGPEPKDNKDYLTPLGTTHCREIYLGKDLSDKLALCFQPALQSHWHLNLNPISESMPHSNKKVDRWSNVDRSLIQTLLANADKHRPANLTSIDLKIEYICPSMITDKQLSMLPPTQLIAGEDELFYDEIHAFGCRLSSLPSSSQHQYIIGKDELHIYPYFSVTIPYLILTLLGLGWLFNALTTGQPFRQIQKNYVKRALANPGIKNDQELAISKHQAIHSEEAYECLKKMARFMVSSIERVHAQSG